MQLLLHMVLLASMVFSFTARRASRSAELAFEEPSSAEMAYEVFLREVGEQRDADPVDYHTRLALFEKRREEVRAHNAQSKGWVVEVNKFADYTDAEFQAMLGHRLTRRSRVAEVPSVHASLLQSMPEQELAQAVDWRTHLNASRQPKDQGGCGSCWAVASAGALETHAEAHGHAIEVSYEQLVDCVENKRQCGGQGGCMGATAELAFGYVSEHGLSRKHDYRGYQSGGDGHCRPSKPAMHIASFVQLPQNEAKPLQAAVAQEGPVVVSTDATNWGSYKTGVYQGCSKDAIINHAVLLMGYGTEGANKDDWWLIRNSWGSWWGEEGYIRLLRHKEGVEFCGDDRKPLEGVGCVDDHPDSMPVCGMCGVLSDSAYPTGVQIAEHA